MNRPKIRQGFRLQWERVQNAHVLLYPEGMVKLNASAGQILSRCSGDLTVADIVKDLERAFGRDGLTNDVEHFLAFALERGWIEASP